MNDSKTLQNIAEKACQFDRAHFVDDVPVTTESLLSYHERLPPDRKLITRLRPRYAVALGFFEGYVLAIEDGDELRSGPFIEHLRMLIEAKPHEGLLAALERVRKEHSEFRRVIRKALGDDVESTGSLDGDVSLLVKEWKELKMKLAEAERTGAEHATQLEDEIRTLVAERDRYKREATELKNDPKNIGIVIKPPPPPPPAAPPAPNELSTEIDDELAQAAANHANEVHGYESVHDDPKQAQEAMSFDHPVGWASSVQSFVYGAQWQLSRAENAHAGDDPTTHLPPVFDRAQMPSDREIAELVCRTIYPGTETSEYSIRRIVDEMHGDDPEMVRRKVVTTYGSVAEACAIEFALLHFRDRLVGPANEVQNAERAQYETTIRQKNERIAELATPLTIDGKTPGQVWDEAYTNALRRAGLVRYADWNTTSPETRAMAEEAALAVLRAFGQQGQLATNAVDALQRTRNEFVKFAALARTPSSLGTQYTINEILQLTLNIIDAELAKLEAKPVQSPPDTAPEPEQEVGNAIVFRDLVEACFWDKHTHVFASKTNTTSQSVATAADEMVEERRKRLPKEDVDSDWLIEFAKRTGSESLAMTPEQMWTDVVALIPESTTPSQVRTMLDRAWRLSASVPRRASEISKGGASVEVTDELLLEAAKFANDSERFTSPADKLTPDRELECAKKAMREDCVMTWYRVCRAYVNGARRSSRKP